MKNILIIAALLLSIKLNAQSVIDYKEKIPFGYKLVDVNNNLNSSIEEDFDNDGIMDLAIILNENSDNNKILAIYLSSNFMSQETFQHIELTHMVNDFEFNNGVLKLFSSDMQRYTTEINLKYDPLIKKMKILSYDEDGVKMKPKHKLIESRLP
jgi:hypothetical protein